MPNIKRDGVYTASVLGIGVIACLAVIVLTHQQAYPQIPVILAFLGGLLAVLAKMAEVKKDIEEVQKTVNGQTSDLQDHISRLKADLAALRGILADQGIPAPPRTRPPLSGTDHGG